MMSNKSYPQIISSSTLREMLEQQQPVTILDVRPAEQRAEWHIPGSIHVDAYYALQRMDRRALENLNLPHDKPVVAVCAAGITSMVAASHLEQQGYQAFSLEGGMKAWSLAWNRADVQLPDGDTRIIQLRRTGKGCLSYLVSSGAEALVIDPSLPADIYLSLAEENGWRITTILDTHIHADHLSRSLPLAEASGATYYLPHNPRARFSFTPLHDGQVVTTGNARLKVLSTPGHTPESVSFLLDEQVLFTGDTLFLDSIGRPDLEADEEGALQRAHALHNSLQQLQTLPPHTLILPTHTGEPVPFDGQPLAATLSEVVAQVDRLQMPESEFVEWILANLPPTPPNHSYIVAFNEAGRQPWGDVTDLEAGANRCAVR